MYRKSNLDNLKKWLFNRNLVIYIPMLIFLAVFIILALNKLDEDSLKPNDNSILTETKEEDETVSSSPFVSDGYLIKVNKSNNFITIYKADNNNDFTVIFKTFRCSVNPNVTTGSYKVYEKSVWRLLEGNVYGQYVSRIGATFFIHSVPYLKQDNSTLITEAYNKLGSNAALGSIYLNAADSKWIYENCVNNTEVVIYEDANEQPQIALEQKVELPFGTGYDPSDLEILGKTSPTKIDYLRGVRDKEVLVGSTVNLWEDIYAADTSGNNITKYVYLSGTLDTSKLGTYTIVYNLVDSFGTVIAYNSIITVKDM